MSRGPISASLYSEASERSARERPDEAALGHGERADEDRFDRQLAETKDGWDAPVATRSAPHTPTSCQVRYEEDIDGAPRGSLVARGEHGER
jgi:hypothetical protein